MMKPTFLLRRSSLRVTLYNIAKNRIENVRRTYSVEPVYDVENKQKMFKYQFLNNKYKEKVSKLFYDKK